MRDFSEQNQDTEQSSFQNEMPFLNDSQVLAIAQNFTQPDTMRQDTTSNLTQDVTTQPVESFQMLPSDNQPAAIQPANAADNILDLQILDDSNFAQPQILDNSNFIDSQIFDNPELLRQLTTDNLTQDVTPQPGESFQLLPQQTSEAKTMLEYPPEDTNFQSGSALEDLPKIDVVDLEPPKNDLEIFPNVINDVDKNEPVTLVITSGQTGETVKHETTAGELPATVAAAIVADKAIEQESAAATQTATTTETEENQDLLFGFDRSTVYFVGAIAGIALLIGFSSFGEE